MPTLAFSSGFEFKNPTFGALNTPAVSEVKEKAATSETLTLSPENTVIFRYVFTKGTISQTVEKLLKLSSKMPDDSTIYLVLDTPGGSVDAGNQLIAAARALPQEVKTVTLFSASMGFITVQSLGERLITPNGVLMSHRARVGLRGQIYGEFESRFKFIKEGITDIESRMAERLGLTAKAYRAKIFNEYWTEGSNAVAQKAADRTVSLACDKDSLGTYVDTIRTFFGNVEVEWSHCPLVSSPLSVRRVRTSFYEQTTAAEKENLNEIIKLLSYPKKKVFEDYVKTDKYLNILH